MPRNIINSNFDSIKPALQFYRNDLNDTNKAILEGEWDLWKLKWKSYKNKNDIAKYAIDALNECDKNLRPNIYTLLHLLTILPVSTASVERTFSSMKRLKTYLRNKTGEDRLTSLALLSIHRNLKIDYDVVLNMFATKSKRRLKLTI
ncbi:hypothetical protein NQ314_003105 [Rhamnusium bicolor]|uniref:HAT C-terminal dimerisation domain-containing protein n=1 Tax=Rhamnusium bicolor TaxID=1586634 RepID=A0AAV8ZMK6_9CUCU|nr:hypothetical protein NQ314_003105 [Rhamnusium bicolor]